MSHLAYGIAAWIFLAGLYGAVTSRNLIHLCLCLAIIQSSTYVLLIAVGYVSHAAAPVFVEISPGTRAVDPVVQAIMLTDIVVEATVMALLLALTVQIHHKTGILDPDQVRKMRG